MRLVGEICVIIEHYDGSRERMTVWYDELSEVERKAFQIPAKRVFSFDDCYNYTGGNWDHMKSILHSSKFTYRTADGKYKLVNEMRPFDDFVEL
jgi:hypothetical protein